MDTHDKIEIGAPVMTPKGPGLVRRRWIDESSCKWQVQGVTPGDMPYCRWFSENYLTLLQPVTRPASEELEVEPDGWMYQDEEKGTVGFVDAWQIEQGFWELNPKLKAVCPLYRHPPAPTDPEREKLAAEGEHPSREDLVATFRAYLAADLDQEERAVRGPLIKAYLRGAGVARAVDLKPEQRADAIAFIDEQAADPIDPEKEKQAAEIAEQAGFTAPCRWSFAEAANRVGSSGIKITHTWGPLDFGEYLQRVLERKAPPPNSLNCSEAARGQRASLADMDFNATEARVAALYAPTPLDNQALQTAIDNTAHWLRSGGASEVVLEVYQTHLAALLEVQRLRAGHCPQQVVGEEGEEEEEWL